MTDIFNVTYCKMRCVNNVESIYDNFHKEPTDKISAVSDEDWLKGVFLWCHINGQSRQRAVQAVAWQRWSGLFLAHTRIKHH